MSMRRKSLEHQPAFAKIQGQVRGGGVRGDYSLILSGSSLRAFGVGRG